MTDNMPRKMALLRIAPPALARLLQLPPGAEIIDVFVSSTERGVLLFKVQGAGWEVREGDTIPVAPLAIVETLRVGIINWNLPEDHNA